MNKMKMITEKNQPEINTTNNNIITYCLN